MDNPFDVPVILSFCPGILGLERGLERAIGPLRVAAYAEIEAFACANLIAGMESGFLAPAPIWTDVKTFPAGRFHGKIHGILGGYPCQPFSNAGNRRGEADPRHLWPYIRKHIDAIRPIWCFFENVAGHLTLGYEQVKGELEALGYRVKEGIYTAEEVGAPHRRERLFILALDNARCQRYEQERQVSARRDAVKFPGETMADPASAKRGALSFTGIDEAGEYDLQQGRQESPTTSSQCSGGPTEWPAGQGQYQYPWEEKRTAESGLGCTIDGYNFREDLLRALGNSVVEQQAEIAFKDLLNKHLNSWT